MSKPRITKAPETRKREIMDAAEALFTEAGYDGTAVSQIVERVGVRQGTFYHYFQSKEELVEAIITRAIEAIAERIISRSKAEGLELRVRVASTIDEAFSSLESFGLIFDHIHQAQNGSLNMKVHLMMSQRLSPIINALIEEGNASNTFRVKHPAATTDFILGGISFLMEKEMFTTRKVDWRKLRPAVESVVESILNVPAGWLALGH